jgi:hypothetical protein
MDSYEEGSHFAQISSSYEEKYGISSFYEL